MAMRKQTGAVLAGCSILLAVWLSAAQSPLQVIKESNRKVMDILKGSDKASREIDARIGVALDEITSFPKISRSIIDQFRGRLTPAQFEELDGVLQEVLRASLVRKLKRLEVDRLVYVVESVHGGSALVRTAAYYEGEKYDLDYWLELADGRWIIVNYVFDDVDAVDNYRQQLAELFAKDPFGKIIARLKKKISAEPAAS